MPLSVAGAFHTEHMAPAVGVLGALAKAVSTHDPRTPLISNRDGKIVHDGRDVVRRIVTQVANPVRWDLCMETMRDLGVTGVLEMPPAGTLTGIIKRALPGVETFALKTPDQLDAAREFVDKHGTQSALDVNPTWRLLVSPVEGHLRAQGGRRGRGARAGEHDRHGPLDPRRDGGLRPARRHDRRVAGRGRRPGLPWPAAGAAAPRGRRGMTAATADLGQDSTLRHSAVLGLGRHRASRVVPNAEIVDAIDSSDEWIQQRSGIVERRWADARGDRPDDVGQRRARGARATPASSPASSTA